MYTRIYVYTYICIYVYTYICIYRYIERDVYMYVCMYIYIYIYIYTHSREHNKGRSKAGRDDRALFEGDASTGMRQSNFPWRNV